ncbi:TlpA disulfide reductase family protein [Flavobacterium pectinovorum]|uniref:TlpA disulfide reductase family protein n=1 Tax=Flavobacterium pectinovorum TaxID=29533 RepID=UPI001FAC285B|nr:TlpA disulfide reductase family protein [Flavobacterium pectinovorum]MCI9843581.1 AhpC/TSA family protein [Flavobacterium pectinovorum]
MKEIKKKILLSILLLGVITLSSAQELILKGSVANLNTNIEIIELKQGSPKTIKSIPVADGTFYEKIQVASEPKKYRLKIQDLYLTLYLEPGTLTVSGDANDNESLKFSGIKTIDEISAHKEQLNAEQKIIEDKMGDQYGLSESAALRVRFNRGWIAAHPDSYYCFDLIGELYNNYDEVKNDYELLALKLKKSPQGIALKEKLETMKKAAKGMTFLNFALKDVDGKEVSIESYKGKYVLIDIWASWCKPCRAENPNVLAAYNKFKDKNFTVLSVSIDDSTEKWKTAITQDALPWTQVRDRDDKKSKIMDYYDIRAIPATFLIDKEGRILAQNLRGGALEEKLTEVLQ